MIQKRYKLEFCNYQYPTVGDIAIDYDKIARHIQASDFSDILEKTDKRIYMQYIDGYNIFLLTERQYKKFIKLLKQSA